MSESEIIDKTKIYYIGMNFETLQPPLKFINKLEKLFQESGLLLFNIKWHECTKGAQSSETIAADNATIR